jgi:hypothetical protein
MLTFANGKKIDHAKAGTGELVVRKGAIIKKNAIGQIVYKMKK